MPATVIKVPYDFSSAEVTIDVVQLVGDQVTLQRALPIADGVQEVNYTGSVDDEQMYGSNRQPQGETDGIAKYEGSITLLQYWWDYINDVVAELNTGIFTARLNIGYSLFKGGNVPVRQDLLYLARIKSVEFSAKQGPENLMRQLSLAPRNIFYNGRDGFGNTI